MRKIILASASPRRRELLQQIGLDFEVLPAVGEEQAAEAAPGETVRRLSAQKADEVAGRLDPSEAAIILGADTIVCIGDEIMGKPKDRADAVRMLEALQGRQHSVFTGVTILVQDPDREPVRHTFACETKVEVYPMERREIEAYVDTGEPMDKAGAYAIQGRFAAWVKGIEGDYQNVVGLPVSAIWQVLKQYIRADL